MPRRASRTDLAFLRQAIALAATHSTRGCGGPFGALLVQAGKIVGRGWNQVTSAHDPTAHAEIVALRQAGRRLRAFHLPDCTLYTSCEPCPMCLAACHWARLARIVYAAGRKDAAAIGFADARLYRELARPRAARTLPTEQLLPDEAVRVMQSWAASADRKLY